MSQPPTQPGRRAGDARVGSRSVADIRRDFPILNQAINGYPLAYLDNAASAQSPTAVIEAVRRYAMHDHANVHRGVHTLSHRATDLYEGARETVRDFIMRLRPAKLFLPAAQPRRSTCSRTASDSALQPVTRS